LSESATQEAVMTYETLVVERRDRIAYVTLNRPAALNALSTGLRRDLGDFFAAAQHDDEIRVVVLTGAGRAFCAGADIKEWKEPTSVVEDRDERQRLNFWGAMRQCTFPIIAAINGFAVGGGCELALCCDIRIASDRAEMGLTEVTLGIIPGGGGTQRLPRLVGQGKALELILTGKRIEAQEAWRLGLVEQVVPHEQLMQTVEALALTITSRAPLAVKYAKEAVVRGQELSLEEGLKVEAELYTLLRTTEDRMEGARAFKEKRPPQFRGR
jgi:enoyl-CoA hydratase/carnithine racemase